MVDMGTNFTHHTTLGLGNKLTLSFLLFGGTPDRFEYQAVSTDFYPTVVLLQLSAL